MDKKGDKTKQPKGCEETEQSCPNIKEVGGGFDGERYACDTCGARYYLDYDDMR